MRNLVVLKFGGSVLDGPVSLQKAARFVQDLASTDKVVVVVSALKGATDGLLALAGERETLSHPEQLAQLLSMGERTAARAFLIAMLKMKLDVRLVDVDTPLWPIITEEGPLDAAPLFEETKRNCEKLLLPLLEEGIIPVVCGFIGKSRKGQITTLGRGGSDVSATLLGKCLGAREVVLVKDVSGVSSSDPDHVKNARRLSEIKLEELGSLASTGAKVVSRAALGFVEGYNLRITSMEQGLNGGTVVAAPARPPGKISIASSEASMITIIGSDVTRAYPALLSLLSELKITPLAASFNNTTAIIYADGKADPERVHSLVDQGLVRAVAVRHGLSCLLLSGGQFENTPGVLSSFTEALYSHGVNVFSLSTLGDSAKIFVLSSSAEKAKQVIARSLGLASKRNSQVQKAHEK
jgi:aspartate kinase